MVLVILFLKNLQMDKYVLVIVIITSRSKTASPKEIRFIGLSWQTGAHFLMTNVKIKIIKLRSWLFTRRLKYIET